MNSDPTATVPPLGPLQLRVMNAIWRRGHSSVHEVATTLNGERGAKRLAYTTFLTVMRNLVRRGLLSQEKAGPGKAHRFTATMGEHAYKSAFLSSIVADYCDGDMERLALYLRTGPGALVPAEQDPPRRGEGGGLGDRQ